MTLEALAVCVWACFGLVAAGPAPSTNAASPPVVLQAPTPSADAIYLRAVHEMRQLSKAGNPPYIVYDLHIDSHNLHWYPKMDDGVASWDATVVHANEVDDYRVWYRSKDQVALVQDQKTHAAYRGDTPFAPDVETADLNSAQASPAPAPSAGTDSTGAVQGSNQVIGAVTVDASRFYDVSLVGVEQRDGVPVYHLHMRAYRDSLDNLFMDKSVDT